MSSWTGPAPETRYASAWRGCSPRTAILNAPRRVTEALERLLQLYDAWGKPAQAAEWKQKLATFQQAAKVSDNKSKTP